MISTVANRILTYSSVLVNLLSRRTENPLSLIVERVPLSAIPEVNNFYLKLGRVILEARIHNRKELKNEIA
jgi:hypothetical protein